MLGPHGSQVRAARLRHWPDTGQTSYLTGLKVWPSIFWAIESPIMKPKKLVTAFALIGSVSIFLQYVRHRSATCMGRNMPLRK